MSRTESEAKETGDLSKTGQELDRLALPEDDLTEDKGVDMQDDMGVTGDGGVLDRTDVRGVALLEEEGVEYDVI